MVSVARREFFRVTLLLAIAFLAGLLAGRPQTAVLLSISAYAGWHLYWLLRLERWLARERGAVPPEASGIWGDIFHLLYLRYRRNRRRKQRIARLMRTFQESTRAMPDGAVALNRHWQIAWFNDAAAALLGLARQDIGQHVANLLRNPHFVSYLADEDFDEPLEIASPQDDERRLALNVVPYGEGEHLLLVRDTTRMFRLQQMRREFVANASHELRSPLTVISGYLEALGEDERFAADWEGPVREMRRQAARMSEIISDLLELSRLETSDDDSEGDALDVHAMLARIREEALALEEGPRNVVLEIETGAHLRGVEKEIYSAFSNLVFNAMRYTPVDGKVTIRWFRRGEEVALAVADTGIGIAKEHLPRITERFYRVDSGRARSKGGTGLGLAIVKHVLQRHGARLEIESTPGAGSRFTCIFPAERLART